MRGTPHSSNGYANTQDYEPQERLKKLTYVCHPQKRLPYSTYPGRSQSLTWIAGYGRMITRFSSTPTLSRMLPYTNIPIPMTLTRKPANDDDRREHKN